MSEPDPNLTVEEITLIRQRVWSAIRTYWGRGVEVSRIRSETTDFGNQIGIMFEAHIAQWPERGTLSVPATWRPLYSLAVRLEKKWPVRMIRHNAVMYLPDVKLPGDQFENRICMFERRWD